MTNVERLFVTLDRIAAALETIAERLPVPVNTEVSPESGNGTYPINGGEQSAATTQQTVNPVEMDTEIIKQYLAARNIQVRKIPGDEVITSLVENIAEFMGQKYQKIKKLLDPIKRSMNTGTYINLDLKNYGQEEVSSICHLGKSLHEIAYLTEYRYHKSPRFMLSCLPNRIPQAINFVNGKWLEIYIKLTLRKFLQQVRGLGTYSILMNPQIVLPNGDVFELDALLQADDAFYWIEAKTGDYQNYVDRYSKMGNLLGIPEEHRFLVLAEMNQEKSADLTSLFGMNVTDIEGFTGRFLGVLAKKYA